MGAPISQWYPSFTPRFTERDPSKDQILSCSDDYTCRLWKMGATLRRFPESTESGLGFELVFMVFEKDAEHTKKDPSEKEEI